nr:hypothetical protein CFP56_32331 [Quercus suber]
MLDELLVPMAQAPRTHPAGPSAHSLQDNLISGTNHTMLSRDALTLDHVGTHFAILEDVSGGQPNALRRALTCILPISETSAFCLNDLDMKDFCPM